MKKKLFGILTFLVISFLLAGCNKIVNTMNIKDDNVWTITQYGPRDINMTFYTIHNPAKGLIVIDGGWPEDAPYVREVINSFGGHVDAWILTHPHADHIGAFNTILPELNEISVSEVYTVKMPSLEKCSEVAPWDNMEAYDIFTQYYLPDIKYVQSGDVLNIKELKIEILSTYDDNIAELSRDYLNDGSMMFRVHGEEETFFVLLRYWKQCK